MGWNRQRFGVDFGLMAPEQMSSPGPPVMSREFLRRAHRVQASEDPDTATAQTIAIMCEHIRRSGRDRTLEACALSAVQMFKGGPWFKDGDPWSDPQALAESCWWYAKHQLKFVHHSKLILAWLGERDQLQLLIAPDALVQMPGWMTGDCAIYTMLICAMLDVLGLPWEIVTLAVDPHQPTIFSHVYPRAVLSDGRRLPLDASHGKYPGWKVPLRDIYRSQVWNAAGNAISDDASQYDGLHGYEMSPGMYGWAGLGQVEDVGDTGDYAGDISAGDFPNIPASIDTSGMDTATLQDLNNLYAPSGTALSAQTSSTGLVPVVASSSPQYASMVASLAKAGLQLATIQSLPVGSYYNTATGQIVTGGTSTQLSSLLSGIGGTSMLLLGGLALFVLLIAMKK